MAVQLQIPVSHEKIVDFCRRWNVTTFSFFGSILRDDFRSDSDIDVLIEFAANAHRSITNLMAMEDELKELFGRDVDMVERRAVEENRNWIRRKAILNGAQLYYVA